VLGSRLVIGRGPRAAVLAVAMLASAAPATALTVAPSAPSLRPATLDPALAKQIAAAGPTAPLRAFVHATSIDSAVSAVRAARLTLVDRFDRVGVAVAAGPAASLQQLLRARGVTRLEADQPIRFHTETSHIATRGLEARTAFQPGFANPIDGRGITIAVVDSGIDGTHPMFKRADGTSKVRKNMKLVCHELVGVIDPTQSCGQATTDATWVDATAINDTDTPSAGGHGTHVASIAAGVDYTTADGRRLTGAAPGADLIGLSVGASLSVYAGASGLDWVLEHHANPCGNGSCPPIRVVNNSWGPVSVGATYNPDDVVAKIQDQLVAAGVTVVWSGGNGDETNNGGDGSDIRTSPYAQSPTPGVIMVANYNDNDNGTRDGTIDPSSSRGQQGALATYPDIAAPGTNITAACRPYLTICGPTTTDDGTISGTSMAAPHISGIVAQLLQAQPTLTPAAIEDVLEDTAYHFASGAAYENDLPARNDGLTSFDKGHGLVDVVSAIARILGVTAPPVPPNPAYASCTPTGFVVTDPAGDATEYAAVNGLPSQPGLDILSLDVNEDAANLTFIFHLVDLTPAAPTGATGMSIESDFAYGAHTYGISARRGTDGIAGSFTRSSDVVSSESLLQPTPVFDDANDTVTIVIPRSAPTLGAAPDPAFAAGGTMTGFFARSRYDESPTPLGPVADSAPGTCPYTLGLGAVPAPPGPPPPPPPPPPPVQPDASLTVGGPAYSWVGEPATGSDTIVAGTIDLIGRVHQIRLIETVVSGGPATLTVQITNPLTAYGLFEIRDTQGNRVAYSEALPNETVVLTVPVTATGRYIVDVGYFIGVLASFSASATLA